MFPQRPRAHRAHIGGGASHPLLFGHDGRRPVAPVWARLRQEAPQSLIGRIAMVSNLEAMVFNLVGMASNLVAIELALYSLLDGYSGDQKVRLCSDCTT